jgi:DNA-binding MarR family transcriptional regulator
MTTNLGLGYLLKQAQYLYRQHVDDALEPLKLTAAQFGVLAALQLEPDATNAMLARMCFVTPQTMIQILAGLQRRGLVGRRPHPQHRRLIQTRLTPRGKRVLAAARKAVDAVDRRTFAPLTTDDREHLTRILQTCTTNLAACEAKPANASLRG